MEAGADLGLAAGETFQLLAGGLELLVEFPQARLSFLDGAAFGDNAGLFGFDIRLELDDALFESGTFLFELDFLGGEFFEAGGLCLFLEVQGSHLVPDTAEILGG